MPITPIKQANNLNINNLIDSVPDSISDSNAAKFEAAMPDNISDDTSGNMLTLTDIHMFYGAIEALKGVSLSVNKGEIVTLVGANGAGKTSLLATICGLVPPKSGTILFNGKDITQQATHITMRSGISISPEGRRIFPDLTILENLEMGGFFLDQLEAESGVDQAYQLFPILKQRAYQRAGTLSGGEQQMLAIGRALMDQPQLLLLDEPSLGLAPLIIAQIFEIIDMIRDRGVTILLIEQNANRALKIADRGYVIENGKIILQDTGMNLLNNIEVKKAYLGG